MPYIKRSDQKQEQATPKRVRVEAIEPIRHDGANVSPGEILAVSQDAAIALVAAGAAKVFE